MANLTPPTGNGGYRKDTGGISRHHRHLLFMLQPRVCKNRHKGVRGLSSAARLFCSLSRAACSRTDSVLKTLIRFVIQRGLLVTLVQVALLTVFYASPRMYWYVEPGDAAHRTVSTH